jgi:hypothetical protein
MAQQNAVPDRSKRKGSTLSNKMTSISDNQQAAPDKKELPFIEFHVPVAKSTFL